ncbi:ABC transporter permease subunit [Streptomyces alkaliphilus]|uniref:ABC transporter permease subunit n=1 Tax=Streptomyces alkaliphilus TaxID=1472722 RepID=A0A7W3T952_9ACTN|nr:ABC transporter permease subunit [Streptomyces alkaliphilus]MBB0242569.1 ABC transporter permease subunit [Streptomyces alkaliphilus]
MTLLAGPVGRRLALRVATGGALLAVLSLLVFVGVDLLPGDPVTARLGPNATPERVAELRAARGLDEPVLTRYAQWLGGLLRGDPGTSFSGKPVSEMLADRVGHSALLAGLCVLLLVPVSLAAGLYAARRPGKPADRTVSTGALLLVSVPEFVIASGLVLLFAVGLGLLPAVSLIPAGDHPIRHPDMLVMPVLSLLLVASAYSIRVIRACAVSVLAGPRVEFLRLTGVRERTILRTAVVPAVLPVAVQVWLVTGVGLVGGAVLVERVFAYPGVGDLLVTAVLGGDLPVVQAIVMILGAAMLLALVLADLAVVLLTPRLRTGGAV